MKRERTSTKRSRRSLALAASILACSGLGLSPISAQDNPIPLNWRNLTVQVIETYGNNFTKPLLGAKVKLELKDPTAAEELLEQYPTLQLPREKTSQTTGARFGQLPPSSEVGPYIVTVIPKPYDTAGEYLCEEKTKRDSREHRMGGGMDQRLTFNFICRKADQVNEFARRAQGGFELTVKVKQSTGTRGNGLWVHLFDKDGNRIKQVRTGGTATAVFRDIDPSLNPYKIEVYAMSKLLFTGEYEMPEDNATYTADLDQPADYGGR